ncbi:hypothetical protein [Endozoicomonas sp. ONNA2]|nr:hypothetical protein [Endozoicomonas sp. ONNA2]
MTVIYSKERCEWFKESTKALEQRPLAKTIREGDECVTPDKIG